MPKSHNQLISKTKKEKLEYLNSLEYSILLKQKENNFYLWIPELCLIAKNADLDKAYQDLYQQKKALFEKAVDYGEVDDIVPPSRSARTHQTLNELKVFIYKLLIVLFVGGTICLLGLVAAKKQADHLLRADLAQGIARSVVAEINKFVDAPENKQKERLEKLHRLLEALQPYYREYEATLLNESCKSPGKVK